MTAAPVDVPLEGRRLVRAGANTVLDLFNGLDAALARHGLKGLLAAPAVGPEAVTYTPARPDLVPLAAAGPQARRGWEAAAHRLPAALDDPSCGGWLALALLTVGDAPVLTGPDAAVIVGWGLLDESRARLGDLSGAFAAGLGTLDADLLAHARPFLRPAPARHIGWPAGLGAGCLAGLALGLGLFLGWPRGTEPLAQTDLRAELTRLRAEASGDVCRLPDAKP